MEQHAIQGSTDLTLFSHNLAVSSTTEIYQKQLTSGGILRYKADKNRNKGLSDEKERMTYHRSGRHLEREEKIFVSRVQNYLIGTYTEPILSGSGEIFPGNGEGIYRLELDTKTGELKMELAYGGVKNPSFLTVFPVTEKTEESSKKTRLYILAVNECSRFQGEDSGGLTVLENSEDGIKLRQTLLTHGADPCHVFADKTDGNVIVSNYTGGSICAYRFTGEGILEEKDFVRHTGKGADPYRQNGPHAHSCIPLDKPEIFLTADLGTDRIVAYRMGNSGKLEEKKLLTYSCRSGNGPRFGEFHKRNRCLYVVNELACTVTVLRYENENQPLTLLQEIQAVEGRKSNNTSADLHLSPDGGFLYVSNRGENTLTVFRVSSDDGRLEKIQNVPSGGRTPRNFCMDPGGRWLLAANQDSDEIVLFERNPQNGMLKEKAGISVPTPVCICPIPFLTGRSEERMRRF